MKKLSGKSCTKPLDDNQREMLLGHHVADGSSVVHGEVWEVNGALWRVQKIVSRDRIVLKCKGKVGRKKPVAPLYVRLWRRLTRRGN